MSIEKAIEQSYQKQVMGLYSVLSLALLEAADNEEDIKNAEIRFSKGLIHAENVKEKARYLAGLD